MTAAKRVLRYLCSTSGMGLVLGGRRPVVLTGHADASWADDQATQRSSQGYTFSLGSGSVSWRSTRSSSVLSSSCEAEIYAGAMAAQEMRWLTYLLTDLGEQPRSPPVLYIDNKAMLALCREHRLEHRTKHIALRYFLARELQQRGQLRLAYVASEANTADIFTKALAPGDHQRFCTLLDCVVFLLQWAREPVHGCRAAGRLAGGRRARGRRPGHLVGIQDAWTASWEAEHRPGCRHGYPGTCSTSWASARHPGRLDTDLGVWSASREAGCRPGRLQGILGVWTPTWGFGRCLGRLDAGLGTPGMCSLLQTALVDQAWLPVAGVESARHLRCACDKVWSANQLCAPAKQLHHCPAGATLCSRLAAALAHHGLATLAHRYSATLERCERCCAGAWSTMLGWRSTSSLASSDTGSRAVTGVRVGDVEVMDTLEAQVEDAGRRHEAQEYGAIPWAVVEAGLRSVWAADHPPSRPASPRPVNNDGGIDVGVNAGRGQVGSSAGGISRQRGVINADEAGCVQADTNDDDAKGVPRPAVVPIEGTSPSKEKQSTSSTLVEDADSSTGGKGRDDKAGLCSLVGVVEPTVSLAPEAGEDFQAVAAAVQANPAVVLLGSGCSHHLMGMKDAFVDLEPSGDMKHVRSFNGALQEVQGRGSVALQRKAGKQELIPDGFYVPGVRENLLSAGQLKETGVKLQEDGDGMLLVSAAGEVLVSATKATPDRLHARLAHVGMDTSQISAKHEVATGLDLKLASDADSPCVSCVGGKLARHTFPDQGSDAEDVLAVVHIDLCGPFRVAAKDGSLYFLLMKDRKTRYLWVRPTKKSVLMLHSDWGVDFLRKQFTDFVNSKGIIHDLTCPYTPQQNGMAEREMRTVMDSVRMMLLHTGVQHQWWHLARRQAIWVRNCLERLALPLGTMLYQLLTGKKPDLSLAWGLHLGVSEERKGWELLDIANNQVVTTSDVEFYKSMSMEVWKSEHGSASGRTPVHPPTDTSTATLPLLAEVGVHTVEDADDVPSPCPSPAPPLVADLHGLTPTSASGDEGALGRHLWHRPHASSVADVMLCQTLRTATPVKMEVQLGPRRTGRLRRPPDFFYPAAFTTVYDVDYDDLQYDNAEEDEEFLELKPDMHADPEHRWDISTMTMKEALASWKGPVVKAAMDEEIRSLINMGTWELVELALGVNIMKNRWVLTTKYRIDDTVEREKVRLVMKGSRRCTAPTMTRRTRRWQLRHAEDLPQHRRHPQPQPDAARHEERPPAEKAQPGAVHVPAGHFNDGTGRVCKLLKSLYGLKQSPLLWYLALNDVLGYADKLRRRFIDEEQTGRTPKTPVSVDAYAELTFDDEEAQDRQEEEYLQKVGSLQFAATTTRPDMAFAYSKLGSGLRVRSDQHWREVNRCLAYFANTRDTTLEFGGGPESLELIGYVDADDAGDKQNWTSTGGYVFVYGGAAVSWSSQRIKCATLSSTESEYVAATEAGKEGRRLRFLLAEFRYIPTTEQPADFLTKALHYPAFDQCSVTNGQSNWEDDGHIHEQQVEEALYFKVGDHGVACWVLVYIDDPLAANSSPAMLKELKELMEAAFELREILPVQEYLGLEIVRFIDDEQIERTPKTPVLVDAYAELTFDDEEAQECQEEEYRQKVGSLQFAATTTRPDIAFAYSKLGSGLTVRSDQHRREVDRCLAYLANSRDTALEFGGGPESLELVDYVDADDAGDKQNRTSTGCYEFVYGETMVSWSSQRMKCATLSATESDGVLGASTSDWGRRACVANDCAG
ncbi:unnamed protein product [Closterium sp. NIES-54]